MLNQNKRSVKVASRGRRIRRPRPAPGVRSGIRRKSHPGARKTVGATGRGRNPTKSHRLTAGRATAERRPNDAQHLAYVAAVKDFEAGVRLFQKEKFDKAQEIFEKLVNSPAREVAARARVHLQLCRQKLNPRERLPAAKTAEDYYNLGVVETNARAFDSALEHLTKADKMTPNQEHIQYALAALHALQGHTDAALEYLTATIKLKPGNRTRARLDGDFESLAADPRFRQLVSA